jgi:5-hydroxyisourate hydrolase-like protein (transthyretin family)
MRRLIAFLLPLALALAVLAPTNAAAARRGRIVGRVINTNTGEPQAGVKVTLVGANQDGTDRSRRVHETDARGRYSFNDLEAEEGRVYTLDARHAGGLFAGRAVSLPSDTERPPVLRTTLRVWETTTDPNAVLIRRDVVFAVPAENRVGIVESVTIANTSQRAYIGRGGSGGRASVGFALPSEAVGGPITIVGSTYDMPDILRTEYGFAATIAVPPGEMEVTFTYPLEGSGGTFDLSRTALYPILDLSVYAAEPLRIESNRLERGTEETIDGRDYRTWRTDQDIDAGDPIQVNAIAEAGSGPLLLGIGIVAAALLAASGLWLLRRRRPPAGAPGPLAPDDLLEAIAALDLRYRAGEIDEDEWSRTRSDLKHRIRRTRAPEPTK